MVIEQMHLIGISSQIQQIRDLIKKVAPTTASVLITGETGTGKELVAQSIHDLSSRTGKFEITDCGCIQETLAESELFGSKRGSYTSSVENCPGKIIQADKGTLFLDEISNMNHTVQSKLLRFIENMTIEPVGGGRSVPLNIRILSATNQNLDQLQSTIRSDLYYRLKVCHIHIPPLRERSCDITSLSSYFISTLCTKEHLPIKQMGSGVINYLEGYEWPGNIRELKHSIHQAVILSGKSKILSKDQFHLYQEFHLKSSTLYDSVKSLERLMISQALKAYGWNVTAAGRSLGVKRTTLAMKIKSLGLLR